MNLITRIIPALIIGLSGPTLAVANPAGGNNNSSFSFSFSSGYAAPHARSYRDSYRPHARAYSPRYQPPAHINTTYVEKRIYNYSEYSGGHGARSPYRDHRSVGYGRGHGGYYGRPSHTGYARIGHY